MRVLLLGGTTEASKLAISLESTGIETVFSYAGRTAEPVGQPVPVRVGGFGGVEGLCAYITAEGITHVIDATHPFAAQMGTHAFLACQKTGVPLLRLERPPWSPQAGDDWINVPTLDAACNSLPPDPAAVFLAIGRMHVDVFARRPEHHYLLRLVDTPATPIALRHHTVTVARGPFETSDDTALMRAHGITHLVAKNAGGAGAVAKIKAARILGVRIIMVDRPERPDTAKASDIETVLAWLPHDAERGV